jgi:hypothetical protein
LTTQQPIRETASEALDHPQTSFAVHDPVLVDATLVKESAQTEKVGKDTSVSDKVADPKAMGAAAQLPPNHDSTPVQILRRSTSAAAALVDKRTATEAGTVVSPTRSPLPTSDPEPANHEDAGRQQEHGTPIG